MILLATMTWLAITGVVGLYQHQEKQSKEMVREARLQREFENR